MSSLLQSLGSFNIRGLFGLRGREDARCSAQKMYSTVMEGNAEGVVGGLRSPESADVPLEIPEQIVEVVKPLWKIWHTDPANHILLA
ncbi:MAG TPA: hypothetical protein ACFYD1_04905, partial [Candidatus Hypogeohydataceae bacterium YC38]